MASGPRHLRDSFSATGVRFTEQTLNVAQKAQAQANLGITAPTPDNLTAVLAASTITPVADATYTINASAASGEVISFTTVSGIITAVAVAP